MAISLADLMVRQTKASIYAMGLSVAQSLGLPVTSWQPGDPTRSLYHLASEMLAKLEEVVALYVAAGFLDTATGDWLTFLASEVFGVDRVESTFAGTNVTLTNAGGGATTSTRATSPSRHRRAARRTGTPRAATSALVGRWWLTWSPMSPAPRARPARPRSTRSSPASLA